MGSGTVSGSARHPGQAAVLNASLKNPRSCHEPFFLITGWHLWAPTMPWTLYHALCILHLTEPSWPPNKGGHADLGEMGPTQSQSANHRAAAGWQVGLLPHPVSLSHCQTLASTPERSLLDHSVQPPHFSDGETDLERVSVGFCLGFW